jgi:hypothetical protein
LFGIPGQVDSCRPAKGRRIVGREISGESSASLIDSGSEVLKATVAPHSPRNPAPVVKFWSSRKVANAIVRSLDHEVKAPHGRRSAENYARLAEVIRGERPPAYELETDGWEDPALDAQAKRRELIAIVRAALAMRRSAS